ncbi:MAG: cob(I)yrinic acid a,c-diamide adenosyltransferase [Lachnospiraceae bacterium]|nr:cob(I)yrinic acid a,c-diamide adenosyltransferase [Lachnospiraceae bacterium]
MEAFGLVHLYYGEGKGKSTAAAGLALRALKAGAVVLIVRFLKSESYESGETELLKEAGAFIVNGKTDHKFVRKMDGEEKKQLKACQDKILRSIIEGGDDDPSVNAMDEGEKKGSKRSFDEISSLLRESKRSGKNVLLVLDEVLNACTYGLLDEELLRGLLANRPERWEIVLTGRDPKEWMTDEADYVTEFKCVKHAYDAGIRARRGIEY